MPAVVDHSFPRKFLLDEERLRKLSDIIETRLAKDPAHPKLLYRVDRADSYSYTTEAVEDVSKEDNEAWQRITRLDLLVKSGEELRLSLSFSQDGCELHVTGADRDGVLPLSSDVKEYIQNEVAVVRTPSFGRMFGFRLMLGVLISVGIVGSLKMKSLTAGPSTQKVKEILANPDLGAKLNYLIESTRRDTDLPGQMLLGLAGVFFFMMLAMSDLPQKAITYAFPGNEFLLGKRRTVFEKRTQRMGNFFWIVVVGMAVTVIGGFVVWLLTRPR